jgi:hypothetical protein
MLRNRDRDIVTFGVTLMISLVTMGVFWHFVLRAGVPPQDRIDLAAQPVDLWRHFNDMASYSARLGLEPALTSILLTQGSLVVRPNRERIGQCFMRRVPTLQNSSLFEIMALR